MLSAGPTPAIDPADWEFTITAESGAVHRWDWEQFLALPSEDIRTDIHCVTRWSKLGTTWRGVSLDTLFAPVETNDDYVMAHSYGGYTTNLPLDDLLGGKAWIAFGFDGEVLEPEHGGPARLLVPHLYFWKSAKWVRGLVMQRTTSPASGSRTATTSTATPGWNNGIGERLEGRHRGRDSFRDPDRAQHRSRCARVGRQPRGPAP